MGVRHTFGSMHTKELLSIKAQCSQPVAQSSWACLPLTSSLLGLPVCRLGAKPQNLGARKITEAQTFHTYQHSSLSPPSPISIYFLNNVWTLHSSQEDSCFSWLSAATGIQPDMHSFCLSKSYPFLKVNAWHDIFLQTFLPASWEWLLAPLWSIVLCIS